MPISSGAQTVRSWDAGSTGTLSVLVLRMLSEALAVRGIDPAPLLDEIGVSRALLDDADARLPAAAVFRALELAPGMARDERFCLQAADEVPSGAFEVIDFAMQSAATMGDALACAVRYYALIDDGSELRLERTGDLARLVGCRTSAPPPRAATELLFGLLLSRGSKLAGRRWPLREVSFVRAPPRDRGGHERFFGVPVRYGRRHNELVFDGSWLDSPCAGRDPALARFLDRQASVLLGRVSRPASFLDELKRAIAARIRGGDPRLEHTAKQLGVGPRTLQRRLEASGRSYKDVADEVRRELGARMLSAGDASLGEIAFELGFFDRSAFHRAFKRWTGVTPAAYRRRNR